MLRAPVEDFCALRTPIAIEEFYALRHGLSRKINRVSEINRSNSFVPFAGIVKFSTGLFA